jgi:hypothetical protein
VRSVDVILGIGLLSLAAGVAGAAVPPTLEVTVPDNPVRVGDRVPVRVTARGGEDLLWGELRVAVEPDGPWAVVDGPREIEGTRPPVWEVVLAPMKLAELDLPELTATVRDADGAVSQITAAPSQKVEVSTVLPEGDEVEPVPLRDPVGVRGFPWEWVLPLAVPVLAVAAAFALWRRRRRTRGDLRDVPVQAPLAEFEALLDRLADRVGREPAEGVCDRLAAGMRRYLERQSDEPAGDMTSFELRLMARRLGWSETVRRGLQEVMAVADSVRFGRLATDEARLRGVVGLARDAARDLDRQLALRAEADAAAEAAG